MDEITVFNTHCCGEIGDVVTGIQDFNFKVCNTIIDLSESYQSLVRKKAAA